MLKLMLASLGKNLLMFWKETKMKIKKLKWIKKDSWIATTPFGPNNQIAICFEQGKFWPIWPDSIYLGGFDTLEDAMEAGQSFHETQLKVYLEDTE